MCAIDLLTMSTLPDTDPIAVAQDWLSAFAAGIYDGDARAVAKTFQPGGWLRDVLTFTWDLHSCEGREMIVSFLSGKLGAAKVSSVSLSGNPYLRPKPFSMGSAQGYQFGYTYETPIAHGKGFVRLLYDEEEGWLAHTVSTIVTDLKGHEEPAGRYNFEEFVGGLTWGEYVAKQRRSWESDPHVVMGGSSSRQRVARCLTYRSWWGTGRFTGCGAF